MKLPSQKTWPKTALISLALVVLTAFAFWPVHQHPFIGFDDDLYVTHNYVVQEGLTSEGVAWAFTTTHGGNWHPLTWLSHMLDCELFGPAAAGRHHLVNLFFHIANTVLLFLIFSKMPKSLWRSAFVAALFALHPLHVESVAWVAERKDVLSAFFGFLMILFYFRYVREKTSSNGSSRTWIYYFLAFISLALGLLCKPMLVTFPFVLLLLDFWPLERGPKSLWPVDVKTSSRLLVEKLPFFALVVISSAITFMSQRGAGAMATFAQMDLPHRVGNAFVAYVTYLEKTFLPRDLAVLYPLQIWPLWKVACAVGVLIAISAAAVLWCRRRPYFLMGWLWYLGILVPVIGLVHVGSQSMADRYTYLPLVGIFVAVVWGLSELVRVSTIRTILGVGVLAVCISLTRQQLALWHDGETLFRHTLRLTKNNVLIQNNLAAEFIAQRRFGEALALLNELQVIQPNFAPVYINLGAALEKQGDIKLAMTHYQKAIRLGAKNPEAENNLGFLILMQGDSETAALHFNNALKLRPRFPEPHYNLANICFLKADFTRAAFHYEAAIRYRPDYAEARSNLGYTLLKLNRPTEALPHLETALRLKPDYAQAHNNLAETFLRLGKFAQAESHSREAVRLEPNSAAFQNGFGLALASQRKWTEAAAAFSRALELKPSAELHFRAANSFLALNRISDARAHYASALQLQPDYPEAEIQLAMLFLRERDNAAAIFHFRRVVAQRPEWKEPLNNLAWLLATASGLPGEGSKEAVELASRAVRLTVTNDFSTLDTLAAAYAQDGQFQKAMDAAQSALIAARQLRDTNSASQITTRLELYRQAKPYRE